MMIATLVMEEAIQASGITTKRLKKILLIRFANELEKHLQEKGLL